METGNNNTSIGYNASGTNNLAIGYSALMGTTTGSNCTAIGYASSFVTLGISSLDNFLIGKTFSIGINEYIVKYHPIDSKWAIYYGGQKHIANNINFISCTSKSTLFEHEGKKIGCFIVNADKLEKEENGDYNLVTIKKNESN